MLKAFTRHQVVLADYDEMPNSPRFISLGEKNEETVAHTILSNCLDEGIDMILPLRNFEISPLAKAKVLFDEFNVEILLPNDGDLSAYFDPLSASKHEYWAVFRKGEAIFASMADEQTAASGQTLCLNGAFYINYDNAVANLKLITI